MLVEETFYRPEELGREARTMPAETYNLAHTQLAQSEGGCLFVPIRSMQFLAVLDHEEFAFVDRAGGRTITLSWQRLRPQARTALAEPVSYEVVYYHPEASAAMARLQGEFLLALRQLKERAAPLPQMARVIKLDRRRAPRY